MTDTNRYNKDELEAPSFVTEEFVVKVLRDAEKDPELKLIQFETKPGSGAADHYASVMFKILVSYESKGHIVKDRRLILKTIPEAEGVKKEFLEKLQIFANEIKMYSETLPAMEEILNQHGETKFWPTMIYCSKDPLVLVFDDLTQYNAMQYEALKLNEIDVILEKIAKYHALSMVLASSDRSDLVKCYQGGFDANEMRGLVSSLMDQAKIMGTAVKSWPGMERIGAKLESSMDELFDNYAVCYGLPSKLGFNVLNHGDFHIRNMMFTKDDQGSIQKVCFLDFQVPLYQSGGFDLVYMLNAMGDKVVREHKMELIKKYYDLFVEDLQRYGYSGKVPSVIDVHADMLYMAPFDAFQKICFGPVFFDLDLTGVDLSDVFGQQGESPLSKALQKLFKEPKFIQEMTKTLKDLDTLGVFD